MWWGELFTERRNRIYTYIYELQRDTAAWDHRCVSVFSFELLLSSRSNNVPPPASVSVSLCGRAKQLVTARGTPSHATQVKYRLSWRHVVEHHAVIKSGTIPSNSGVRRNILRWNITSRILNFDISCCRMVIFTSRQFWSPKKDHRGYKESKFRNLGLG
jgi:hypothetical protein